MCGALRRPNTSKSEWRDWIIWSLWDAFWIAFPDFNAKWTLLHVSAKRNVHAHLKARGNVTMVPEAQFSLKAHNSGGSYFWRSLKLQVAGLLVDPFKQSCFELKNPWSGENDRNSVSYKRKYPSGRSHNGSYSVRVQRLGRMSLALR